MKKLFAILCIASLLCSCAAEKRLARFLERHPELQRIDTVYVTDTIFVAPDSASIQLTLSDLVAMDSIAKAASDSTNTTTAATHTPSASVTAGRSEAVITANGDGTFNLSAFQKPDTVVVRDTLYVPHLVTEYKDKPVEVYKMHWYEKIFAYGGAFVLIIAMVWLLAWIIVKFAKPL